MSYRIRVLNNSSLTLIGTLEHVINIEIYEVINDQFTADIQIAENTFPSFLHYPNLLEIDGDYFIIASIDKQRDNGKEIKLMLEHVSYELNNPSAAPFVAEDEEEFYEGSPGSIISQCWGNGAFQIVDQAGGYYYYRPSARGGRSRMNEFARQNGLEMEYTKFTITIRNRRGANNGLVLEVGKNIRSITEKIELNDSFAIEYAHEVDIIDFSKMTGSQQQAIASANLGDTVTMIDRDLAIYASERIVGKRYNPLFKEVPQLDVGQVIRDIVNIINNDEKEEEKEEDPSVNYFLQSWQIGSINCMALSGIELDEEDILPDDISASIDYYIEGEFKGMSLTVKPPYSNYHVYIGEWYEDNRYEEYKLASVASVMNTWTLPKPKMEAISITISEVPLENLNPEIHKFRDYAVKFNKAYIDPLREFKIGKKNMLGESGLLIDTEGEDLELDDFSTKLNYHLMQEYEGVKLSLRREFNQYTVSIMTFSGDGIPFVHDYESIKDQLPNWKLPREDAEYLLIVVSEVPFSQFNPKVHKNVVYGVAFEKIPFEPFYQIRVGDINCLQLSNVMLPPSPALNEIQAEIFYQDLQQFEGLRITLQREFRHYYVRVTTYSRKGVATVRQYEEIMDWNYPRLTVVYMVIEAFEKPPSVFNPTKHKQACYGFKFTEQSDEPIENNDAYYLESETVTTSSTGARFDFTVPYDQVISVTLGVGQTDQTSPVTAHWSLVQDAEGLFTGVFVHVKGLVGMIDVSVQAVCHEGVLEVDV
ncbi:hypothetical protein [Lysinibacillus parviboronicapiens]|uniref:hypothetical protein n=1 Tax=Lysinibacillus parviboronicapiens TaxID=436516 RepID=UPI000D332406|nr:hypothetical protein [Lysinibacillus parviboronicapiens]